MKVFHNHKGVVKLYVGKQGSKGFDLYTIRIHLC